jgi:mycothiol synthase
MTDIEALQYEIKIFNPQDATEASWDVVLECFKNFINELYPDDPIKSKDSLKTDLINPSPYIETFLWIVTKGNKVLGLGRLVFHSPDSPMYEKNKHIAFGMIFIEQEYRRLGIGTELGKQLVKKAKEMSRTIIESSSFFEPGHNFSKKLGGTAALQQAQNRLKLEDANWSLINEWKDTIPKSVEGVKIERFNTVPDKDIQEYCDLFTFTLNQMPHGKLEDEYKITPEILRISENRLKDQNATWITMISREKDGRISGHTEIIYYPDQPTVLFQGLTGVKEENRGRGLGKLLKAKMLSFAIEEFPDVKSIITANAVTNEAMLAINTKMGFTTYQPFTEYKFQVSDLLKRFDLD